VAEPLGWVEDGASDWRKISDLVAWSYLFRWIFKL